MIDYLTVYGQHNNKGTKIHDPMCELFPTEVKQIFRFISKDTKYMMILFPNEEVCTKVFCTRFHVTCMWALQQDPWIEAIFFAFYKTTCSTKSTFSSSGSGGWLSSSSQFLDSSTEWREFSALHSQGKSYIKNVLQDIIISYLTRLKVLKVAK